MVELSERIHKGNFEGKTLTLKIKYGDFKQITRSITVQNVLKSKEDILPLAKRLLHLVRYDNAHTIRLMGLSVSNPGDDGTSKRPEWIQLELEFKE